MIQEVREIFTLLLISAFLAFNFQLSLSTRLRYFFTFPSQYWSTIGEHSKKIAELSVSMIKNHTYLKPANILLLTSWLQTSITAYKDNKVKTVVVCCMYTFVHHYSLTSFAKTTIKDVSNNRDNTTINKISSRAMLVSKNYSLTFSFLTP